jgi:hypothetical protein
MQTKQNQGGIRIKDNEYFLKAHGITAEKVEKLNLTEYRVNGYLAGFTIPQRVNALKRTITTVEGFKAYEKDVR